MPYTELGEHMNYTDICNRQVINVIDGSMIGLVNDVEFDPCTYVIRSIFVHPAQSFVKKLFPWFFSCDQIEIPTREIENIAGDVILVKFHC